MFSPAVGAWLALLALRTSFAAEAQGGAPPPTPAAETAPAAPTPTAPAAANAAPAAVASPAVAPPPPRAPRPSTPFRLAMTYTHVLREGGDLTNDALSTNALGLLFVSPSSTYVRDHFAVAYQWESAGAYSARGFRVDLISFGYPIRVVDVDGVTAFIEPIVTALRGEIMFVSGGSGAKFLRLESGLGLELSVAYRQWFFALQPLAVDFRYWFYGSAQFDPQSRTGLGQLFPLRLAIGHEF